MPETMTQTHRAYVDAFAQVEARAERFYELHGEDGYGVEGRTRLCSRCTMGSYHHNGCTGKRIVILDGNGTWFPCECKVCNHA